MANTELTTISRKDVKDVIAPFSPAVRAEIDKAIALANDFAKAHGEEATRLAIQRAIALYHIAEDKEAVKKAGFKTFKELAGVLFNLGASSATNYRSAAEQFYCNADAPKVKEWFGPSGLYEFIRGGITNEAIQGGIDRGELKSTMTNSDIRAWVDAQKSLTDGEDEDGNAKLAKLYDATITALYMDRGGNTSAASKTVYAVTEEELHNWLALCVASLVHGAGTEDAEACANGIENDRFGKYNPHAELDNGKKKTAGKGLFIAYGDAMAKAVYFPAAKAKAKAAKGDNAAADTIKAQNDTIAALMAKIAELEAAQNK